MSWRAKGLWWLSPAGAVLLVVPITLWLATQADDAQYRARWRVPKALTNATAEMFVAAVLVFSLAAMWQLSHNEDRPYQPDGRWPHLRPSEVNVLERSLRPLYWLTVGGYAAILGSAVLHGLTLQTLRSALIDQNNYSGTVKRLFVTVPGITTLTQVGIAFIIVAAIVYGYRPTRALRRQVIIIVVLAVLRTFLLTERLAVLELVVPAVALMAMRRRSHPRRRVRQLVQLAPLLFIPALIAGFGVAEYSRSWVYFSNQPNQESFAEFTVSRISGYYATAYNNGQLYLTYGRYPNRIPYLSLEALWSAPLVSQLGVYEKLNHGSDAKYAEKILETHGSAEFNSPGGVAIPFVDFGTFGGFVFFVIAGSATGWLYRRFRRGDVLAVLLYPMVVIGLFELPRFLYWTAGRVVPAVVAALAVTYFVHKHARPVRSAVVADERVVVGQS